MRMSQGGGEPLLDRGVQAEQSLLNLTQAINELTETVKTPASGAGGAGNSFVRQLSAGSAGGGSLVRTRSGSLASPSSDLVVYDPAAAPSAPFRPQTFPNSSDATQIKRLLYNLSVNDAVRLDRAGQMAGQGRYGDAAAGVWGVARQFVVGPFRQLGDAATYLARKMQESAEASTSATLRFNSTVNSVTGGNADSAARLETYGKAAGLNLDNAALRLHQRVMNGNGYVKALASQSGVDITPEPFGNADYGDQYLRALRSVRAIKDPQERLRRIRTLGLDDAGNLLDVSDATFDEIERTARTTARLNDGKQQWRASEQQASRGLAQQAAENRDRATGQPWARLRQRIDDYNYVRLNAQAEANKRGTDTIDGPNADPVSKWLFGYDKPGTSYMRNGLGVSPSLVRLMASGMVDNASATRGQDGSPVATESAQKRTLSTISGDDTDRLVNAMQDLGQKMVQSPIGGGERTKNALPSGLTGRGAFRSWRRGALRQGAL